MQLETQWGTVNVSCFEAVPGRTPEDTDGTPDTAYGYGKLPGRMHALLTEYPYGAERKDHEALLAETAGRLRRYHAPDHVMKELESVTDELKELPVTKENYSIVHYDFEPDNVLYDKKTDTFGVIDFDDAIRCWFSPDVARARCYG